MSIYMLSLSRAWLLWFPPLGLFGAHHFYLRRYAWAFLYLISLGLFGIGWIFDFFRLPHLVQKARCKAERAHNAGDQRAYDMMKTDFDISDAYCLWLPPCGLFGAHHFYLRNFWWGTLYFFTVGIFGIGWLFDFFCLPALIQEARARQRISSENMDILSVNCKNQNVGNLHLEVEVPSAPENIIIDPMRSPAPANMSCSVCMDRRIDCVYLDCGHSSTCLECAQRMINDGNHSCPICRSSCRMVRRIFITAAES